MDKSQLTLKITEMLSSSTHAKVYVSTGDNAIFKVVMISNSFDGKTFSARFKHIDSLLSEKLPEIYSEFHFRYQAFTTEEFSSLSEDERREILGTTPFRQSAKEL